MFCWDLHDISGRNWLLKWDCVFLGGTLYPFANYDGKLLFLCQPILTLDMLKDVKKWLYSKLQRKKSKIKTQ